ncbi:prolyl oligopeptidase family serine peptidase [Aquirufa salirivi]|uniref:prolyl oligopeptidase n=1 Tax=Aquirufa salirivi TaxID=3104729 RepID=A0ABW8RU51_9BACT
MSQTKLLIVGMVFISATSLSQMNYPKTKKIDQVDNYHGTQVLDPYRWLEDDHSMETNAWVKEQNELSFGYLNQIPLRLEFKKRIEELSNYEKISAPFRKGNWYYFYKNSGLQNQAVLFRQKGLKGKPEQVIDPNTLSKEGTTRLTVFSLNKTGKYACVGLSINGSDWQTFYVRDMETGKNLADELRWVKVSGVAWKENGFYYSRYPEPGKGKELSTKNENHQVWFHTVGTSQSQDQLIYEDAENPQRFHTVSTTDDERFVILTISDRGKGLDGNALWVLDTSKKEIKFKYIIAEPGKYDFSVVDNDGDVLIIETNDGAPNNKIVRVDPSQAAKENWKTMVAEMAEPLQGVSTVGNRLFLTYLMDVTSRVKIFDYNGNALGSVNLPGLGNASGFGGEKEDKFTFYTYSSFNFPPTIYRYDLPTKRSSVFQKPTLAFNPMDYSVVQKFYPSKDGTQIPMFIVSKKGINLNGKNPTILYGYGGFNISSTPAFSASLIPWLEKGGIYVVANLRGGSEYGEKWHEAGMKFKKQNVFDDFIAGAEFLIREKYTSSAYLAASGRSNGGLLVGAAINQRPDLFAAALPGVGVMDMLRFQKFTIGWNWVADYGSSDNSEEFKALYAYSPLHNIKAMNYPATMVFTSDHDDRVVPAHSFKYAATLQEKNTSSNPMIIRIDTNSGHGSSNTAKLIELTADSYAFALFHMGKK